MLKIPKSTFSFKESEEFGKIFKKVKEE